MPKNIVVCCDGTNNDIVGNPTNVLRLYRCLVENADQVVYYDAGVGTLADPVGLTRFRRWLRRNIDSGIGYSLRDNFCGAYGFISRHYQPGDRIYLFGFSRGAYAVRAVAGAIHKLGLIRQEHAHLIPHIWALYANDNELDDKQRFEAFNRYRKLFAVPDVKIHFVGVWDTVSSLGWIWDYRTLPSTADNPSICTIRHAVSRDERRACFRQNLFLFDGAPAPAGCDIKEYWFRGVHSDVGGGYPDDEGGLSKVALEWMLDQVKLLVINPQERDRQLGVTGKLSKPDPGGARHESLCGWWWFLELLPRKTWGKGGMRWRLPNFGRRRRMPPGAVFYP